MTGRADFAESPLFIGGYFDLSISSIWLKRNNGQEAAATTAGWRNSGLSAEIGETAVTIREK
jgi:hypothetical protein